MNDQNKPMPLSELPSYLNSVREKGQGDYVPVVDVGRIVDPGGSTVWFRRAGYMAAFCVLLVGGALTYGIASTREITIVSDGGGRGSISDMIAEEGGRVISVRQEENGVYKVKVFTFGGVRSLVERLKGKKDFKRVELED